MKWYFNYIKNNYFNFRGRATRKEYWMFILFYYIFSFLSLIPVFITMNSVTVIISSMSILAIMLPKLAVTIRRCHDIGISGWWYLVIVIFAGILSKTVFMIIPIIILFIITCKESQEGENKYGENPKEIEKMEGELK